MSHGLSAMYGHPRVEICIKGTSPNLPLPKQKLVKGHVLLRACELTYTKTL